MPTPEDRKDINNPPLTPEQRSYEQGYTKGQGRENDLQYQRERAAENSGAASGLAIGGILATLVGLGAAYYYWGQPAPTPTTIINNPPVAPVAAPVAPQKETRIIERTIEKTAPAAPPKVVKVPTPVLVPGATKVIEVPKPFAVPVVPATGAKSDSPAESSTPAATPAPATTPTPTATPTPATSDSLPSPDSSDAGTR
jgi:hypothetical protein